MKILSYTQLCHESSDALEIRAADFSWLVDIQLLQNLALSAATLESNIVVEVEQSVAPSSHIKKQGNLQEEMPPDEFSLADYQEFADETLNRTDTYPEEIIVGVEQKIDLLWNLIGHYDFIEYISTIDDDVTTYYFLAYITGMCEYEPEHEYDQDFEPEDGSVFILSQITLKSDDSYITDTSPHQLTLGEIRSLVIDNKKYTFL